MCCKAGPGKCKFKWQPIIARMAKINMTNQTEYCCRERATDRTLHGMAPWGNGREFLTKLNVLLAHDQQSTPMNLLKRNDNTPTCRPNTRCPPSQPQTGNDTNAHRLKIAQMEYCSRQMGTEYWYVTLWMNRKHYAKRNRSSTKRLHTPRFHL